MTASWKGGDVVRVMFVAYALFITVGLAFCVAVAVAGR